MVAEVIFWLLFFHFVGDYVLQTSWMLDQKVTYRWLRAVHCCLWTGAVALGFKFVLNAPLDVWPLLFLFAGHYVMDSFKHPFVASYKAGKVIDMDLIFHLIQLGIVAQWQKCFT